METEMISKALEVDHVGIVVSDLDGAISKHVHAFASSIIHREVFLDEGIEIAFLDCGNTMIEFLTPITTPETDVGNIVLTKFLSQRGDGLHHICYRVQDLEFSLDQLIAKGFRLVENSTRQGALGRKIAFLHPSTLSGVLTELVEVQSNPQAPDR